MSGQLIQSVDLKSKSAKYFDFNLSKFGICRFYVKSYRKCLKDNVSKIGTGSIEIKLLFYFSQRSR